MIHYLANAATRTALCGAVGTSATKDRALVTCRRCLRRLEQIDRKREKGAAAPLKGPPRA